jgi:hypothetical protein
LKPVFALLLVALLALLAPAARAQQYTVTTLSTTNAYAATSTNAVTDANVNLTKHDLVALEVSFKLTGAGTSAVLFNFHESLDGTAYDDTAVQALSLTAAGTTTVRAIVPVNAGAVGYLGLRSVGNPNASGLTNLVIRAATKPKRQG